MIAYLPQSSVGVARFSSAALFNPRVLPRNLGLGLLAVYRRIISPLYGDVCRYYPSCSAYAVGSVQQYGLIRGSFLALRRIVRCHPWAESGEDDVRPNPRFRDALTPRGFVVPVPQRKD